MESSKAYMKDNGILPRISFNDLSAHTVKLMKDKVDSIPDANSEGGRVEGMKYLVNEDGESKSIFTTSIGLISKLATVEEGATVTIQMYKQNNKSYYRVTKDGAEVVDPDTEPGLSPEDTPSVAGADEDIEQPEW